MKDNSVIVLSQLVAALDIQITRQSLKDELQKHPDSTSLLALSNVLTNWNIPNAAYEIDFDNLRDKINGEFIAVTSGRKFLLVNRIDDKEVIVSNEHWRNHKLTIDEFKAMYLGLVLVAEKDETSGETHYPVKRRREVVNSLRVPVVIIGGVVLFIAWLLFKSSFFDELNLQIVLITLFKTVGLFTAVLLIIQSIDSNNPLVKKLCGSDKRKSCNAILSSKAAKVSDELSWSEVGLFYFAGTWLVLLFNSNSFSVLCFLALLNLFSLPYTFYSIYHQWRVAKQWCKLCCVIQALLWLEFFTFMPFLMKGISLPNLSESISLISGMAVPVLAWILIKPYLLLSKLINPLKGQLRTFKYDNDLFKTRLEKEQKHSLLNDDDTFIIGNREAQTTITVVSNPFCSACAGMHAELIERIEKFEDIKVQIIFLIKDDASREFVSHLLSIKLNGNDSSLNEALHNWYDGTYNYNKWASNHPVSIENTNVETFLNIHEQWCEVTNTQETPMVYINGYRLPEIYQFSDLKYLL
ncbi:hypothetical protein GCM10027049_13170 [Mucilaginibacter puniceus]